MKIPGHFIGNYVAPYSALLPHSTATPSVLFRQGILAFVLFLLSALSTSAQPGEPEEIPVDTALITTSITASGDSLSYADSLALADTVQPELRIGIFGGPISTTAVVAEIPLDPQHRNGLHAGIRAEMEFGYPIYFLVEFEYAQKGIRSSYDLASGLRVEEDFLLNYLDVPILYRVGIPVAERLSLSAGFGAHISFLLSRDRILRVAEVDSSFRIDRGLERFDFGVEGRIGGEFTLSPKWGISADFRYLHGLQNILILEPNRTDNRSWKSRSFFFSAGVMYQLQRSIREL